MTLYRDQYRGFTARHFHDKLVRRHGFGLSYTWTKLRLQEAGLVAKAPRRSAHRKKRPRRPLVGMLLHQDGSRHRWLPALDQQFDLIVTLDDASSVIYSALLVEEEGTRSTFQGLAEVIGAHGLPCALYTDRASHYFHTPKAGEKVAKDQLTQVGRALAQLGIEHIPAYSPEARGRCERAFGTLQDRLPKELQLAGITTLEAANRFLHEVYCPSTTRGSRCCRNRRARRSWPIPRACTATSSVSRRSAWSGTTTACATATSACRSRRARCGRTSSRRRSASTITPTARSRSFTGPAASPAIGPTAGRSTMTSSWPPDAAGRPALVDLWTSLRLAHQPHRAHHHNSGQIMCYQNRST